jgi:hypothetical protein
VIVLIFLYILGRQGFADCEKFIHFVLWLLQELKLSSNS